MEKWKPSPRFAALFEEAPGPVVEAVQAYQPAWGFGSAVANKAYSPPAPPVMPSDWWKRDQSYVARAA